jgi:DTW domain-containing protein YfiP
MEEESDELVLSSWSDVEQIKERAQCTICGRKRMYFCYDCRVYMPGVAEKTPHLELPVNIDIIKHTGELNSKSTAIHCQLLAPTVTRIFDTFESVPDYSTLDDRNNIAVVYPSKNALTIEEFVMKNGPVKRFVFLDATWYTVGSLRALPQLKKLQCVSLEDRRTKYWRPQKGLPDTYLATIEAIYYTICEHQEAINNNQPQKAGRDDKHTFDDLLFWFSFFRTKLGQKCNKS